MDNLTVGEVIDMSLDDFKVFCESETLGMIKSYYLFMTQIYSDLNIRKESIKSLYSKGEITKEKCLELLNGLYGEMLKIEAKATWLKQREKELLG